MAPRFLQVKWRHLPEFTLQLKSTWHLLQVIQTGGVLLNNHK